MKLAPGDFFQRVDTKEIEMGWIGTMGQLEHYLTVVKADRNDEGRFLI